jgi:hypothetical protein
MAKGAKLDGAGSTARTSKYDVEVAQAKVAYEEARNKGLAQRTLAQGLAWAVGFIAFGGAVWLMKGVVHEIAGKKTIIEADIVLKAGLVASITINIAQFVHGRVRKTTIKRERKRSDELETKLGLEINVG